MGEEVVFSEDDAAARPRPDLVFWESRHGVFFLDEESARRDGATHKHCACGQPTEKYRESCSKCHTRKNREEWLKLPLADAGDDWTLLFDYDGDRYFNCEEEAIDWGLERGIQPQDLMLVTAEPEYAEQIDYNDYYSDDLPHDTSLEDQCPTLAKAWDRLNEEIGSKKHVLSYWGSNKRVVIADHLEQEVDLG